MSQVKKALGPVVDPVSDNVDYVSVVDPACTTVSTLLILKFKDMWIKIAVRLGYFSSEAIGCLIASFAINTERSDWAVVWR